MISSVYKQFIFYICCFYIITLFTTTMVPFKKMHIKYLVCSLLLCLETIFLKFFYPESSIIASAFSLTILTLVLFKLPISISLSISTISYCINLLIYEILSFFAVIIVYPIHTHIGTKELDIINVIVSSFCPVILYIILKNKRIRNSSHLFLNLTVRNISFSLSLFALCIITFEQISSYTFSMYRIFRIVLIILITFVLVLWWRAQITKSYRERLRVLEVESLRTSQTEQQTYIKQLEEQNERMGKIIHKDNRLVNAMADSISQYLVSSAVLPTSELQSLGASLSSQISEIHEDRQVLLNTKPATPSSLPQTGHAGIDAMITYMSKEAAENKIEFHFHYGKDFFENNVTELRENDLAHLLSDTLENAIIATRFGGGGVIELSMLKIKGIPTISISDSGIPFELDTYMNLGLQKASTHLDTGGSGIGLMDLWALKEKYMATLYIDEHPEAPNMTKHIVYIFDRKNRYMISTNRFKELQQKQTRADLFVINPNTEAVI